MENKKKILIIDDDPKILNLSSHILTAEGYLIVQASSGEEALKKIHQEQPDLIIVDVILPDMNGAEIIQEARNKYACRVPVIFLTGMITKTEEADTDMNIKIKDIDYIVIAKPYDKEKFVKMVLDRFKRSGK